MSNKPVEHFIDHHLKVSEEPNPDAVKDVRKLSQPADRFRIEEHSNIISCSQKIFTSFTKLCHNFCNYCTLIQSPFKNHHSFMNPDQVLGIFKQGKPSIARRCCSLLAKSPICATVQLERNWLIRDMKKHFRKERNC